MKNKTALLSLLLISTAVNAIKPQDVKNFLNDNATPLGCVILAFITGYFYGDYKSQQRNNKTIELLIEDIKKRSAEAHREWCIKNNLPATPEEAKKRKLEHLQFMDQAFCEKFHYKICRYLCNAIRADAAQFDADCIPLEADIQADLPRFKEIKGQTAFVEYSAFIKQLLVNAEIPLKTIKARA